MSLMSLTAVELGKKIKAGEVTVKEAVEAAFAQIEKVEGDVHSFVTLTKEQALKDAGEIQKKIDAGELTGPLAGVPVALKDNLCTKGVLTTCSSKILNNFVPTYTAQAVSDRLKTDLWNSISLRTDRLWLFLRSDWTGSKRRDQIGRAHV